MGLPFVIVTEWLHIWWIVYLYSSAISGKAGLSLDSFPLLARILFYGKFSLMRTGKRQRYRNTKRAGNPRWLSQLLQTKRKNGKGYFC